VHLKTPTIPEIQGGPQGGVAAAATCCLHLATYHRLIYRYPYRYRWIPARYKSLAFNGAIEAAAFWHLISGSVADAKYSSLFLVLDREQV